MNFKLRLHHTHPWNLPKRHAFDLQKTLSLRVKEVSLSNPPHTVGGVDVGYQGDRARAAVVVLSLPRLTLAEEATAERPVTQAYIPGLLSFRELPTILEALERLSHLPDVLICDGQGRAHPRRLGIASHLGVLLDHPTIGCAKSRLVGQHAPVPDKRGAWVPLVDQGEVVGAVVRTRVGVKPVYVSVGHRITLHEAIDVVLQCTPRFRLPEPIRLAHHLSRCIQA